MMYFYFKNLVKHTFIYGFGNMLNSLIAFLLIPIYTRFLMPAEYGVLSLIFVTTGLLVLMLQAGINDAITRLYFSFETEKDKNQLISSGLFLIFICFLIFIGFAVFISDLLSILIFQTINYTFYFQLALLVASFQLLSTLPFTYLRIKKRSLLYICLSFLQLFLAVLLTIIFVVYLRLGIKGVIYSHLILQFILASYLVFKLLCEVGFSINKSKIFGLLKFGLPLVPAIIFYYLARNMNLYFLQRLGSLREVGLYSLGFKFGNVINMVLIVPFVYIFSVKRFEILKKIRGKLYLSRTLTYFILAVSFFSLIVALFIRYILYFLVDSQYVGAYIIVPIILLSSMLFGVYMIIQTGILFKNKTYYILLLVALTFIFNLILNILFINRYSLLIAALVIMITYCFQVILTYFLVQRIYYIKYEKRVFLLFLIPIFLYFLGSLLELDSLFLNVLYKIALVLSYPLLLFLFNFYKKGELIRLKKLVNKIC